MFTLIFINSNLSLYLLLIVSSYFSLFNPFDANITRSFVLLEQEIT